MKNSNSSTGVKVYGASILLEIDLGHNYYRETKRKLSYQWIHVQQNVIFMVMVMVCSGPLFASVCLYVLILFVLCLCICVCYVCDKVIIP